MNIITRSVSICRPRSYARQSVVFEDGYARKPRSGEHTDGVQRGRSRRGMALYLVVIIIAMLSLAGLSFVALLSTESEAVSLQADELQLESVMASGEEVIKLITQQSPETLDAAGGVYDNPDLFRGVAVLGEPYSAGVGRFSVIAPRSEDDNQPGPRFGVQNESARLNLAVLPEWDRKSPGAGREALMRLPGMTDAVADALLDWVDADPVPRQFGAEDAYYASQGLPYGPRNTIPASLEELLLVRDVSRQDMFGGDTNFNHVDDPGETPSADVPWASLLTVHSAEKNVTTDGRPRVYLNERDLAKLHAQLVEALDREQADFIIYYRQFPNYVGSAPANGRSSSQLDFSITGRYRITSALDLIGVRIRLPKEAADSQRTVLESPFSDDPAAMRQYLPELLDKTTVDRESVIRGRINVNEAPRAVLAAVPGLDDAIVERILGQRGRRSGAVGSTPRHATWLLEEELVDLSTMKKLMPYVTGGGGVFRAQVVGFFDLAGPSARAEVVIDGTTDPRRRVYYKDLRYLGRGYSLETLGAAADGLGASVAADFSPVANEEFLRAATFGR